MANLTREDSAYVRAQAQQRIGRIEAAKQRVEDFIQTVKQDIKDATASSPQPRRERPEQI